MTETQLGVIPRRIKEARERLGISQDDLAQRLGKLQQQVGKWESKNIDMKITQLAQLADVLEVPTDYLLGRTDDTGDTEEEKQMSPAKRKLLWYIDQGMELDAMQATLGFFRSEQGAGQSQQ